MKRMNRYSCTYLRRLCCVVQAYLNVKEVHSVLLGILINKHPKTELKIYFPPVEDGLADQPVRQSVQNLMDLHTL